MNEEEKKQFEELKTKVEDLTKEKDSSKAEVEALKKELAETKEANTKVSTELDKTQKELQDTREAYKEMFGDKGGVENKGDKKDSPEKSVFDDIADIDLQ